VACCDLVRSTETPKIDAPLSSETAALLILCVRNSPENLAFSDWYSPPSTSWLLAGNTLEENWEKEKELGASQVDCQISNSQGCRLQ
jgi:hypothetical protein